MQAAVDNIPWPNRNHDLVDYLKSINNENRRYGILEEVGKQLKHVGVSNKKILGSFIQLAHKTTVPLLKLTDDEISSYCCRKLTSPVYEDDKVNYVCGTVFDVNDTKSYNAIQELQTSSNSDKPLNSISECNVLEERNNEDRTLLLEEFQNDTDVFVPEENMEDQSCNNITPVSALRESNVEDLNTAIDTSNIDQTDIREDINIEESSVTKQTDSLAVKDTVKKINVEESSVTKQTDSLAVVKDTAKKINVEESSVTKQTDSLAVKDTAKKINVEERKTLLEKSKGYILQSKKDEVLEAKSRKLNDDLYKFKDSNNVQQINHENCTINSKINKKSNCQAHADEDNLDNQLEKESCAMKNQNVSLFKEHKKIEETSKEGSTLSIPEKYKIASKETNSMADLDVVRSLSGLVGASVTEANKVKGVSLKSSTVLQALLTEKKNNVSTQPDPHENEASGQKPLISVRKNLFEQDSFKYPEINVTLPNKSTLVESNNELPVLDLNKNTYVGTSHLLGKNNKVKGQRKEDISRPLLHPVDSSNFGEGLKQLNVELKNFKKRLSQDPEEKIKNVKKRRLSAQNSRNKFQEKQQQVKQLKDQKASINQNKSFNEGNVSNETISPSRSDSNVSTLKSQMLNNLEATNHIQVGNNLFKTNYTQQAISDVIQTQIATKNRSINEVQNPQEITIQSILNNNFNSHQAQPCDRSDTNAWNKPTNTSSSPIMSKGNKTPFNMTMKMGQKSNNGKTLDQTIYNLMRRKSLDSAQVPSENNITTQSGGINALGMINSSTTNSIPLPGKPENVASHVLVGSEGITNKDRTTLSHAGENRLHTETLTGQLNHQTTTGQTQTGAVSSNHPAMIKTLSPEINRYVEKAIQKFLNDFCNRSDDNLNSIPEQVRSCLTHYCTNYLRKPSFKKLSEFLKLYMVWYVKLFNDEELSKKTSKIAELLHLSIADCHRQRERKEQAVKLHTDALREEEVSRANKDYEDILFLRGNQFAEMFLSVLPKINQLKGCEFLMLVTFYFKITQALMQIDSENEAYIFSVRDLMKQLLKSSQQSPKVEHWTFFGVEVEDFKSNCLFVKKCMMTLYMSGYHEAETEIFWKLVRFQPIIPNFQQIMAELYSLKNTRTQTVGSGVSSSTVVSQTPTTFQNLLRVDTHHRPTHQIPVNIGQQSTAQMRRNPPQFMSQLNQAVNSQNVMVQQRAQYVQPAQVSQRANPMAGIGAPSQLPPFASLNHPQVMFQPNMNVPASSNSQANQYSYYHANRGHQQAASNFSSAPTQPHLYRRPYIRPPPPYPGATTQLRINPGINQLWQPVGPINNIQIPVTSHQEIAATRVQNMNVSSDEAFLMTQKCAKPQCSELANLICSLCKTTVYCSTECQTSDWYENHSDICLQTSGR